MLVAEAVSHRFAQIRSERMPALRLEYIKPAEGPQYRVLNQIRGIGRGARPIGKTTVGPATERRKVATE